MFMASVDYIKRKKSARYEMFRKMREAKERKRMERMADEPIRIDVRGTLVFTISIQDRLSGALHSIDLRISKQRLNSFDVSVDGKPWKKSMSASRLMAAIRKKIVPRWRDDCF